MQDNQPWKLPQKFYCYKKTLETLLETKYLFKKLFIQYKICFRCIFRIYSFEHPKLYNDTSFCLQILPLLLQLQPENGLYQQYNVSQCCMEKICWLCQTLFQKSYINSIIQKTKQLIKEKGYSQWQQFKLNIRIPSIILLKNIILARFIYFEQNKNNSNSTILQSLYNILILPYEANKIVQPKTVQKWVLSNNLCNETLMSSTSQQHYDNLIINLEQDYDNDTYQHVLMKQFSYYLGLEKQKKKQKNKGRKTCLDLGQEKEKEIVVHKQEYKCNGFNLNKIIGLKHADFSNIFNKFQSKQNFLAFLIGQNCLSPQNSYKISLFTRNIYLCGRYIKFSRYLSQTPWVVNGKKLTQGSLQQEIQNRIYKLFYPNLDKEMVEIKFHSGGRQDIDVRMLKGGRPFVLQFVNPIKPIKFVTQSDIIDIIPTQSKQLVLNAYQKWKSQQKQDNGSQLHSWRIVKLLQLLINQDNQYVQVLQLQQTTQSFISVELKAAQTQKIKHYLCYIYSIQPLTEEDKSKLDQLKDLKLQQLTPLRVLHRRTLMFRDKMIHRMRMHLVSVHSAILEVWASAGTYIKQFVHGDLGRTTPNVGSLLSKQIDILQLDVGSLKEGEWKEGDEQFMKMDKFEWMN